LSKFNNYARYTRSANKLRATEIMSLVYTQINEQSPLATRLVNSSRETQQHLPLISNKNCQEDKKQT